MRRVDLLSHFPALLFGQRVLLLYFEQHRELFVRADLVQRQQVVDLVERVVVSLLGQLLARGVELFFHLHALLRRLRVHPLHLEQHVDLLLGGQLIEGLEVVDALQRLAVFLLLRALRFLCGALSFFRFALRFALAAPAALGGVDRKRRQPHLFAQAIPGRQYAHYGVVCLLIFHAHFSGNGIFKALG